LLSGKISDICRSSVSEAGVNPAGRADSLAEERQHDARARADVRDAHAGLQVERVHAGLRPQPLGAVRVGERSGLGRALLRGRIVLVCLLREQGRKQRGGEQQNSRGPGH